MINWPASRSTTLIASAGAANRHRIDYTRGSIHLTTFPTRRKAPYRRTITAGSEIRAELRAAAYNSSYSSRT